MDIIFDFIVEVVLGTLMEGYIALMVLIVPEEKNQSKKVRYVAVIIALLGIIGVIALFVAGAISMEENQRLGGALMIAAGILSVIQILLGIIGRVIAAKKRNKH